jgi:ubiquinone/menaquinone biosynthesis C-methylase UbiE
MLRSKRLAVALVLMLPVATAAVEVSPPAPRYDFTSFRSRMEDPKRVEWQRPDEVIKRLHLRRGQRVADVGAGTGYFTVRLARAVGARGRVYAVDIDERALKYMRQRFRRAKLAQITVIEGTSADPKLPAPVDLIFICDTWHHIDSRAAYARALRRYLTRAGRLVIVDFKPDADPAIGPPKEMRLSPEQITEELRQGGFGVAREPDFLPLQYVLVATAAPDGSAAR